MKQHPSVALCASTCAESLPPQATECFVSVCCEGGYFSSYSMKARSWGVVTAKVAL
jgi:hypothetical protein